MIFAVILCIIKNAFIKNNLIYQLTYLDSMKKVMS